MDNFKKNNCKQYDVWCMNCKYKYSNAKLKQKFHKVARKKLREEMKIEQQDN